jgi:hypothetical protein
LTINAITSVKEAAWVCHDELSIILDIQDKLSKLIRKTNDKDYDVFISYIPNKVDVISGILSLTETALTFNTMPDNKRTLTLNFEDIIPYAVALFNREVMKWENDPCKKPEEARCLRIQRKDIEFKNTPEYFCVFYNRNDVLQRLPLTTIQSRYLAEMYANKINSRIQNVALRNSLNGLSSNTGSKELDLEAISPIKNQIRNDYIIVRHKLTTLLLSDKINKSDFDKMLTQAKEKVINNVCMGSEQCLKAIDFLKGKGLLELNGDKFALDMQNPFNSLIPKTSLRINLPNAGDIGKKLVDSIKNIIHGDDGFIPDSAPGELPNVTALKRAINTFSYLRDDNKKFNRVEDMSQICRVGEKSNFSNIKRKVAILQWAGVNDPFFNYLGKIGMR